MANVYLDANYFLDLFDKRRSKTIDKVALSKHLLFISPLSVHILVYVYGYTIPNKLLSVLWQRFNLVSFDQEIVTYSLQGPTEDFEDNVELHSAAKAGCHLFLTRDKKLLAFGFFGRTKIHDSV